VKKRVGYGMVIMVLLTAMLAVSGCGKAQEVVKEPEIPVNTALVQVQDLAKSVNYSGIVRGKNEVYLMPKVAARVTAILVQPGDPVKAGQTLMSLDNTDFIAGVQQAEAGLHSNELQVESARADYDRAQTLQAAGAMSDQQLEQARLRYETLLAGSAQAQAGLLAARTALDKCTLTSPIDGVVGSIGLSLGDTANPAMVAAVVSDNRALEVEVLVSEAEVSYIQKNSQVKVYVRASQEAAFTGVVESIASVADPSKHNYTVKVGLANPDGIIKSGMFADLYVDTLSKQNILTIPVGAVIPTGGRQIVFVIDQEGRARETEVKTGIKNDKYVEIVTGLQAGQEVIIKGNTLVSDGTLVKVVAGGTQ
jgi:RND family efflux transporter MFP subunit